jgi:hypothetical protein
MFNALIVTFFKMISVSYRLSLPHVSANLFYTSILKMEAVYSSETLDFFQILATQNTILVIITAVKIARPTENIMCKPGIWWIVNFVVR